MKREKQGHGTTWGVSDLYTPCDNETRDCGDPAILV